MRKTAFFVAMFATVLIAGFARSATFTPNPPPSAETLTPQNLKTSTNPGWMSQCVSERRKGPLLCSIEESIIVAGTGQTVATVAVRMQPATHDAMMLIRVPVGLYLPAGISVQIDDGKAQSALLQTCDLQGCLAEAIIATSVLTALKSGKQLSIVCQTAAQKRLVLPLPLVGFGEALQKIQ